MPIDYFAATIEDVLAFYWEVPVCILKIKHVRSPYVSQQ